MRRQFEQLADDTEALIDYVRDAEPTTAEQAWLLSELNDILPRVRDIALKLALIEE